MASAPSHEARAEHVPRGQRSARFKRRGTRNPFRARGSTFSPFSGQPDSNVEERGTRFFIRSLRWKAECPEPVEGAECPELVEGRRSVGSVRVFRCSGTGNPFRARGSTFSPFSGQPDSNVEERGTRFFIRILPWRAECPEPVDGQNALSPSKGQNVLSLSKDAAPSAPSAFSDVAERGTRFVPEDRRSAPSTLKVQRWAFSVPLPSTPLLGGFDGGDPSIPAKQNKTIFLPL